MIVTGETMRVIFLRLLGNGKEFGLTHIHYAYQEGEGGIADALSLAAWFAEGEKICVVLGDNIIENNIIKAVKDFERQEKGAKYSLRRCRIPKGSA
jgi:glucose-1-phosphate thymidylyltransferase